ncbi:hypothetical protein Hanom_Chr02g00147161 [Helianthus anomalus]
MSNALFVLMVNDETGFYFLDLHRTLYTIRLKQQTVFFPQTAEVWSTSSHADVCRCGPQTADL